jgi:hypothetical protein
MEGKKSREIILRGSAPSANPIAQLLGSGTNAQSLFLNFAHCG